MLVFLPFIILFSSAVVLFGLQAIKLSVRNTWFVCLGVSFVLWVMLLVVPIDIYKQVNIGAWLPFSQIFSQLSFQLDHAGFFVIFCLMTTLIAVIISAVGRLQQTKPSSWIGYMFICSLGILAIIANDPLSLVLAWSILDIFELIININLQKNLKNPQSELLNYGLHILSTLLLLWAFITGSQRGNLVNVITEPNPSGILVFMAAILRLGIFPINSVDSFDTQNNRGLGTLTGIVAPASGLVLLTRIPINSFIAFHSNVVEIIVLPLMIYSAIRWLCAKDEIQGRRYWMAAWGGFLVICALEGALASLLGWGAVMLMLGSVLFLYSFRANYLVWIPVIGIVCMIGLPFTITQEVWSKLVQKFQFVSILLLIIQSILLIGGLHHIFKKHNRSETIEKLIQLIYGLGLFFPVIGSYFLLWKTRASFVLLSNWWIAFFPLGMAVFGTLILVLFKQRISEKISRNDQINAFSTRISGFFNFHWLSKFFSWFFRLVGLFPGFISGILEGEGGILWAILLLALLISLLRSGGG